ncbi:hypothetical protein [Peptoniphilus harei]|uniref:hypothetical protein n=1 Tax=Peptoniphilus harei TaxID=54005 RepID=UPI0016523450|nr:hypothetical protein [Peptoniphilus harei]
MIELVQERIDELLENADVKKILLEEKSKGKSNEEVREILVNIAIATLYGI